MPRSNTSPLIYVVAGEPSGDLLGGRLIKALRKKHSKPLRFAGVGGKNIEKEGNFTSLFPLEELTLFGLAEIIPHIPRVLKRLQETANDILTQRPDVVVTIDSPGFNFRLAKRLKGSGIRFVHYAAPTVWAWKAKRAAQMAKMYDHVMTLFPFEPPYFQKEGLEATFVGHPLAENPRVTDEEAATFRKEFHIEPKAPLVCLLPGSRKSEVTRLLPLFKETLTRLQQKNPTLQIVLPTVKAVRKLVEDNVMSWPLPVHIIENQILKDQALKSATVALAASGTVTLELALAECPMVVAYKINALTAFIAKRVLKTPYVCLVNILEQKLVVPELLQENCTPPKILEALHSLLHDQKKRTQQLKHFKHVKKQLSPEFGAPSEQAAQVIFDILSQNDKLTIDHK